jgi:hypothetical protein
MTEGLQPLVEELESVAARLRAEDLDGEAAAALVERCAELAGRIGAELDARSRAAGDTEGQEPLL